MTMLPMLLLLAAGAQSPQPLLRIVLLVDTSGSMTSHLPFQRGDRTLLTDAAAAFTAAVRPEESQSVTTFGDGGASPLWDALDTAVRTFDGATGRRALLVITDGRTTGNTLSFAEILQRLQQARVPVFFICAERSKEAAIADPSIRLRQIATATGGQYQVIRNYSGLARPKPEEIRRAIHRALDAVRKDARGPI